MKTALLLTAFSLLALACSKQKPAAPTTDFARRQACPASMVQTTKEGPERMRVSGCGKSEVFVWRCASNSPPPSGPVEPHTPTTEAEARAPRNVGAPNGTGCAWSRERDDPDKDWRPGD